jgi:hypothetical protein
MLPQIFKVLPAAKVNVDPGLIVKFLTSIEPVITGWYADAAVTVASIAQVG